MALSTIALSFILAAGSPPVAAGDVAVAVPAQEQDTTRKAEEGSGKKGKGKRKDNDAARGDSASKKKKKDGSQPSSAEKLAALKAKAEALPLFRERAPLTFTLIANFKRIARERDTLSTRRFPGTLIVPGPEGRVDTIPVQLRTRGHYRLARCSFVPMRVEFPKKASRGTPIEGQDGIKLSTHCERNGEYEQYVLREYLAYRVHELVSPIGFRARLAHGTYVDSASGKTQVSRFAFFVVSEQEMAARAGGRVEQLRGALFADVDEEALLNMSVFNYMIGGHDWSMYALHNVRLVVSANGRVLPVPYDFDFSGLVNARYATPDPKLNIRSVRARLNRGPCRTREQLEPTLARFRSVRTAVLALYDSLPALDKGYASDAKDYLTDFFRTIDRPGDVKAELVDICSRQETS
jgi:hypothetical protein